MLNAIFRPLKQWPGTPTASDRRRGNAFGHASYIGTLDLLERELQHLKAQNIVIQAYFQDYQIRNDGLPKEAAAPSAPGVIVSFNNRAGDTFSYPCDVFLFWQHNLRAIALSLESLRRVDRFGVTKRGEQYSGFKQLPAGAPPPRARMTPEAAAALIANAVPFVQQEGLLQERRLFDAALALAKSALHPDAGGSHEEFVLLGEAAEVLTEYHLHSK